MSIPEAHLGRKKSVKNIASIAKCKWLSFKPVKCRLEVPVVISYFVKVPDTSQQIFLLALPGSRKPRHKCRAVVVATFYVDIKFGVVVNVDSLTCLHWLSRQRRFRQLSILNDLDMNWLTVHKTSYSWCATWCCAKTSSRAKYVAFKCWRK